MRNELRELDESSIGSEAVSIASAPPALESGHVLSSHPECPVIRIAIAEDHRLVADAMVAMFTSADGFEVIGTATSGTDAVALVAETSPDVVLMDVGLVGLNGIEATRRIVEAGGATRVLMLTMHDDQDTVARAVAAGAAGFVPKTADREVLFDAVRALAKGEGFIDQRLTGKLLARVAGLVDTSLASERLTTRELEVLEQMAAGLVSKEIARKLMISTETVKSHLTHIYQKLGVGDRTKAVVLAIRRGLIP
jgi:DNA-binding NarL/FixJ family response regulator